MHTKIGTLDLIDGMEIAGALRSAGIKVEIKPYFDVEIEEVGYIRGRIDELVRKYSGTEYEGIVREWEGYLKKGEEILKRPMSADEFISSFVNMFVEPSGVSDPEEFLTASIEKICEERNVSLDDLTGEARAEILIEAFRNSEEDIKKNLEYGLKRSRYEYVAYKLLEFSGIDECGDVEELADNIEIDVEIEDAEEAEKLDINVRLKIDVRKVCDVYTSTADALYERSKLLKVIEEFDEAFKLLVVADIATSTHRYLEGKGKVEVDEIVEVLESFELGENIDVSMDDEAARELLKLLEKEELVKIKKGRIKALD
jgi:hypothetical protein